MDNTQFPGPYGVVGLALSTRDVQLHSLDKTIYQGEEGVRLPCSQLFAVRYLNIGADLCCGLNVLPLSLG